MASCDECKNLVEKTLNKIIDDCREFGCSVLATEFEVECLSFGDGTINPVGEIVRTVAAEVLEEICENRGSVWIRSHVPEAAEMICKEIVIC